MAEYTVRCNLVSATFPFFTSGWGRTVIFPQYDINYDRQAAATIADFDKDKGIPQVYYAQNVMPTIQGFQSVGFVERIAGNPLFNDFDQVFALQTSNLNRILFSPSAGKNYIYTANTGVWTSTNPIPAGSIPSTVTVTTAFVQGQTYICYANYGIFTYDDTTGVLSAAVPSGLVVTDVKAICASNGYLIAITDTDIAWSSLIDPMDFVPSLDTGAGGGSLNEAQGALQFCLSINNGFLIYCESNIVSGSYSGNINFPFIFRSLVGSSNIQSPLQIGGNVNMSEQYAWTSNGVQKINRADAINIYPELTDFFTNSIFEDFDETDFTLTETYLTSPLTIHVRTIANRYVCFSYGINKTVHTHALIYDLNLKRFGKLKINHRDIFQWNFPNLFGDLTYEELSGTYSGLGAFTTYDDLGTRIPSQQYARETIAIVDENGRVVTVDFDLSNGTAEGVLLTGKYQFIRNKFLVHQESEVESIDTGHEFSYKLIPSLDGKTLLPAVVPMQTLRGDKIRIYKRVVQAKNVSCLFLGSFNLVSFIIKFSLGGHR